MADANHAAGTRTADVLTTDVLIVGGGPAGASAAISLRQNSSFDVTLVDKAEFPRDKACGDGLSPGIVHLARELGVETLFENYPLCDSYTIVGPDSTTVSGTIGAVVSATGTTAPGGYVIPREIFDAALLARSEECGAKVLTGHSFKSLLQDDEGVTTTVAASQKDELLIRSRVVLGTDGANSRVRSALGVPATPKKRTGIAMRAYAEFAPHSKHDMNRLWIVFHRDLLPAYAWLFPFANSHTAGNNDSEGVAQMANIGVGCLVKDRETSRAWFLQQLENFARQLEQHGIYFSSISSEKTYLLPHGGKLPKLAHNRTALIGDAAFMINPLSGEGIYYGMSAGHMLAHIFFAENTYSSHNEQAALKKWEDSVRQRFAKHLRHNYIGHRLMRHPKWANTLTQTIAADPKVADKAIDLMLKEGTLNFASFARVLRKLFRTSNK